MGNIYKLISVNEVIGKLKIDLEYLTIFNEDHMIEWVARALQNIGSYNQLIMKEANIEIKNHKGLLPCDCYKVYDYLKVTSLSNTLHYNIGNYKDDAHLSYYLAKIAEYKELINQSSDVEQIKVWSNLVAELQVTINNDPVKLIGGESINNRQLYSNSTLVGNIEANKHYNNDIKVEFDVITTGFSEGYVNVKYLALPVDEDGFPMIPDDISYYEAIYWYVCMQLSLQGRLNNPQLNYQICRQEWKLKCVQARANSNMPTLKDLQEFMNEQKLVPDINQYYKMFRDVGKRQIIKRH